MNKIWTFCVIASLCVLCVTQPDVLFPTLNTVGEKTVKLSTTMCGIYAVWLGIMELLAESKLDEKLAKLLDPVIYFLFGKQDAETKKYLSSNLSANLLGIGSAATPSGIEAMRKLNNSEVISYAGIMLLVLNASSLQIVPTSVFALRASFGSAAPTDIFIPSLLAGFASTAVAIILVKVLTPGKKRQKAI